MRPTVSKKIGKSAWTKEMGSVPSVLYIVNDKREVTGLSATVTADLSNIPAYACDELWPRRLLKYLHPDR